MKKIGVFASGTGSNFQAVAKACKDGIINGHVSLLVCDKPDALVISKATSMNVEVFSFSPKNYESRDDYEKEILRQLKIHKVELLVLAGYMRIVGKTLLKAYPNKIINIHPSLLPDFPGVNSIKRAFETGQLKTGVTVHYVDSGVDTGPIIDQRVVDIHKSDTLETLEDKIHKVEHELYVEVLQRLCDNQKIYQ
jgi:phosphoribosylglycinamide formyltransferase-1